MQTIRCLHFIANMKKYVMGLLGFLVLVCLDQVTKFLAVDMLKGKPAHVIWKGVFELRYLENHGAAFGVLQNQKVFLLVLTVLILTALMVLYVKLPKEKHFLALHLFVIIIAAGAVGNMIDRFINSYVVDFFYFRLIDFPIFNVADCYVVASSIMAAIFVLFIYQEDDFTFLKKSKKG